MTPRLKEAAQDYFAAYRFAEYDGTRPEFVVHHTTTRRHYRAGERVHSYRGTVATISTNAELPDGWHMRDLRHRRVTTMHYYHYVPEHLRALVDEPNTAAGQVQGIAGA